ncbi:uncharacterized protein ISCGN_003934 [Ixodes scapularis]
MVSCVVVGCHNKTQSSKKKKECKVADARFFKIPKVRTRECDTTRTLSARRQREWLKRINRKDLDADLDKYKVLQWLLHLVRPWPPVGHLSLLSKMVSCCTISSYFFLCSSNSAFHSSPKLPYLSLNLGSLFLLSSQLSRHAPYLTFPFPGHLHHIRFGPLIHISDLRLELNPLLPLYPYLPLRLLNRIRPFPSYSPKTKFYLLATPTDRTWRAGEPESRASALINYVDRQRNDTTIAFPDVGPKHGAEQSRGFNGPLCGYVRKHVRVDSDSSRYQSKSYVRVRRQNEYTILPSSVSTNVLYSSLGTVHARATCYRSQKKTGPPSRSPWHFSWAVAPSPVYPVRAMPGQAEHAVTSWPRYAC